MKKILLIVVSVFFFQTTGTSQSCLPDGIIFSSQDQIDNFQNDYPGCTEIEGDVIIKGYFTNLDSLSVLTSFGGNLDIRYCTFLESLSGLDNVSDIEGFLNIERLESLKDLHGLGSVTSVGGDLIITNNDSLINLNGLGSLTIVDGDISINKHLMLESLSGIESLESINGGISVYKTKNLSSLFGLHNIPSGQIDFLEIYENDTLTVCDFANICEFLDNPTGPVSIFDNASGCENFIEVGSVCNIEITCLPFGNYCFGKQIEVDDFQNNYPSCTNLNGSIIITGTDITNLEGLSSVTSIENNLHIYWCGYLSDLSGLNSLTSIEGSIVFENNYALNSISDLYNLTYIGEDIDLYWNSNLTSLNGLNSLTNIGDDLFIRKSNLINFEGLENLVTIEGTIYAANNNSLMNFVGLDNLESVGGYLDVDNNPNLTGFSGLSNLTTIGETLYIVDNSKLENLHDLENVNSIGGELRIYDNLILASLEGLDNIEASSISDLFIEGNSKLSACAVKSICDYLKAPGGRIEIHHNNTGCYNQEEVEEACLTISVSEINSDSEMNIFPNPANKDIFISGLKTASVIEINLYNQFGEKVLTSILPSEKIDISSINSGFYIVEIITSKTRIIEKLIIN